MRTDEPNPRPVFGASGLMWGSRAYIRAINEAFPVVERVQGKGGPWTTERTGLRTYRALAFHGKHDLTTEIENEEERNQFNREISQDFGAGILRNHRNPHDWGDHNGEYRGV